MPVLPLRDAASALEVAPSTLERWTAAGCPVARRGGRGRGNATLYDIRAVRAWRNAQDGADKLRALADDVPDLVGDAMFAAFRLVDGPHKRQIAAVLAGAALIVSGTLRDRIRRELPDLADAETVPASVARLRKIGAK